MNAELHELPQDELRYELTEAVTAALSGQRTHVRKGHCPGRLFSKLHQLIDGPKTPEVRDCVIL